MHVATGDLYRYLLTGGPPLRLKEAVGSSTASSTEVVNKGNADNNNNNNNNNNNT
jgi:hypothetical protein